MERKREEETAANSRRRRNAVLIRARPNATAVDETETREN